MGNIISFSFFQKKKLVNISGKWKQTTTPQTLQITDTGARIEVKQARGLGGNYNVISRTDKTLIAKAFYEDMPIEAQDDIPKEYQAILHYADGKLTTCINFNPLIYNRGQGTYINAPGSFPAVFERVLVEKLMGVSEETCLCCIILLLLLFLTYSRK